MAGETDKGRISFDGGYLWHKLVELKLYRSNVKEATWAVNTTFTMFLLPDERLADPLHKEISRRRTVMRFMSDPLIANWNTPGISTCIRSERTGEMYSFVAERSWTRVLHRGRLLIDGRVTEEPFILTDVTELKTYPF